MVTEAKSLAIFSATSVNELIRHLENTKQEIQKNPLTKIALNTQLDFSPTLPFKLSVIASDKNNFITIAEQVIEKIISNPKNSFFLKNKAYYTYNIEKPKIAFLFAGQGSHYLNMGSHLLESFVSVRRIFDIAGSFNWHTSLYDIIFPKLNHAELEKDEHFKLLTRTEWAQPAIGITALIQLFLLDQLGVKADFLGGHSYGEILALHAAGVIDNEKDLLEISRKRGELIESSPIAQGSMLALPFGEKDANGCIKQSKAKLFIANLNSPEQTVVSGENREIEKMERYLVNKNIVFKRLDVSTAFHSDLISGSKDSFFSYLKAKNFKLPNCPIYSNITARRYPDNIEKIKEMLSEQLIKPVRFADQIANMYNDGARFFLEVGPGSILTKFISRCLNGKVHYSVSIDQKDQNGLSAFWNALGLLSAVGIKLNYKNLRDKNFSLVTNVSNTFQNDSKYSPRSKMNNLSKQEMPLILSNEQILVEMHNRLSAVQENFQKTITEAYTSYLRATEGILNQLSFPIADERKNNEVNVPAEELETKNNIEEILIEIISEKTGYPADMLSLDMNFEADLGIDSLKRTEIVATLKEKMSNKFTVNLEKLKNIRSIKDLLNHISISAPVEEALYNHNETLLEVGHSLVERGISHYIKKEALGVTFPIVISKTEYIYILQDNRGIAVALQKKLEKLGLKIQLVDEIPINALSVICLNSLNKCTTLEKSLALNNLIFSKIKIFSQNIQERGGNLILAQLEDEKSKNSAISIDALGRVARHEWLNSNVKTIIINNDFNLQEIVSVLYKEILYGGPDEEVFFLQDKLRYMRTIKTFPISIEKNNAKQTLKDGDTIVISGGGYGIAANCLLELSKKYFLNINILGRTDISREESDETKDIFDKKALSEAIVKIKKLKKENILPIDLEKEINKIVKIRAIKTTLQKLRDNGCIVQYYPVDVCNFTEVNTIIKKVISEFGRVDAVISAAGVISDNYINKQSQEEFNFVFNTKVYGFINLLNSVCDLKLKLICCFSSIASSVGSVGQSAYAVANQTLNRLAKIEQEKRGNSCIIKSINWGPWDGGMVNDVLKNYFKSNSIKLISLDDGAKAFLTEINTDDNNVEVILAHDISNFFKTKNHYKWCFLLNKETCPLLQDHIIEIEVVPIALVIHWCINLTRHLFPEINQFSVDKLAMIKGIKIDDYQKHGKLLKIECEQKFDELKNKKLDFTLSSIDNDIHYKLSIVLDKKFNLQTLSHNELNAEHHEKWLFSAKDSYSQRKLFVGPSLQVISKLKSISKKGCIAYLQRPAVSKYNYDNSIIDVALLDGGIQLSLLWKNQYLDKFALPTSIESLYIEQIDSIKFPVYCHLSITSDDELLHIANIAFQDAAGRIFAYMKGLKMHAIVYSEPLKNKDKKDV